MTSATPDTRPHRIAVIPGDGIGQEVMPEALRALRAALNANSASSWI
jgi:isocitrate/isopropylmalate dehydrogenase